MIALVIVWVCAGVCAGLRAEKPKDLRPQGYVNDFAAVLSAETKEKLRTLLTELDQKADAQIAVVTLKSLDGDTVEDFSIRLATQWGVGPKQKSRGVMILLAPGDHKYRFEVGYGLEEILPDGKVGGFGREALPLLRANDYDGAVLLMAQRVAAVIAEDKGVTLDALRGVMPPGEPSEGDNGGSHFQFPVRFIGFGVFLLISIVIRLIFHRAGGTRRGRGGWWIGPMIGGGGGSWGGGGFGGGGSGGGFGGFGGGSFGGGGASGSW